MCGQITQRAPLSVLLVQVVPWLQGAKTQPKVIRNSVKCVETLSKLCRSSAGTRLKLSQKRPKVGQRRANSHPQYDSNLLRGTIVHAKEQFGWSLPS